MASKGWIITSLVLRICTILFAVGCIVVLLLDKLADGNGSTTTPLNSFIVYRYVLATAFIAAVYCILQLPCTIYRACSEKRLIRGACLPALYYYGDHVVAFMLASGVGAGFLATMELMDILNAFSPLFESFFNKALLATGLLKGAFLCMAFLSMFSTRLEDDNKPTGGNKGFFFR